jgi:hypothetical protein
VSGQDQSAQGGGQPIQWVEISSVASPAAPDQQEASEQERLEALQALRMQQEAMAQQLGPLWDMVQLLAAPFFHPESSIKGSMDCPHHQQHANEQQQQQQGEGREADGSMEGGMTYQDKLAKLSEVTFDIPPRSSVASSAWYLGDDVLDSRPSLAAMSPLEGTLFSIVGVPALITLFGLAVMMLWRAWKAHQQRAADDELLMPLKEGYEPAPGTFVSVQPLGQIAGGKQLGQDKVIFAADHVGDV